MRMPLMRDFSKQHMSGRQKKRKRERNRPLDEGEIFESAIFGRRKRVKRILKEHGVAAALQTDLAGQTALHKAAECGHEDIINLLLRYGAIVTAADIYGNTAAHIAAFSGHRRVFTALMLDTNAPDMDISNKAGVTIRTAMQQMLQVDMQQTARASTDAQDPELSWSEKLAMNEDQDQESRDFFSGFLDLEEESLSRQEDHSQGRAGLDEDDYAQKIWSEMQRRRHAAQGPSAATADSWARADELNSHAKRKRQAAEDAKDRSRKILEEEQAKDRAWRDAVKQGDWGAKRAIYDSKWHIFSTSLGPIASKDVPWLGSHDEETKAIALYGTNNSGEVKQRLKLELIRWHPDKFQARFGGRLQASFRAEILDRVKGISQLLNSLLRKREA